MINWVWTNSHRGHPVLQLHKVNCLHVLPDQQIDHLLLIRILDILVVKPIECFEGVFDRPFQVPFASPNNTEITILFTLCGLNLSPYNESIWHLHCQPTGFSSSRRMGLDTMDYRLPKWEICCSIPSFGGQFQYLSESVREYGEPTSSARNWCGRGSPSSWSSWLQSVSAILYYWSCPKHSIWRISWWLQVWIWGCWHSEIYGFYMLHENQNIRTWLIWVPMTWWVPRSIVSVGAPMASSSPGGWCTIFCRRAISFCWSAYKRHSLSLIV